jgi:pilus assembly protein Flp/PilA
MHQSWKEHQMTKFFSRFAKDESGATAIEYGLIAALIALVLVAALGAVGGSLQGTFNNVADGLNGTTS